MATLTITITVPDQQAGGTRGGHKAVGTDFQQVLTQPIKEAVKRALGDSSNVPTDAIKLTSVTFS